MITEKSIFQFKNDLAIDQKIYFKNKDKNFIAITYKRNSLHNSSFSTLAPETWLVNFLIEFYLSIITNLKKKRQIYALCNCFRSFR